MKLMVISDIHGNCESAKRAIEIFKEEKADQLIILGDYFFSLKDHIKHFEIKDILNPYKDNIIGILGNWDDDVSNYLEFPLYSNYEIASGKTVFYFTHGHIYNKDNLPVLLENEIFVQGHEHVPFYTKRLGHTIISPGSIGHPMHDSKSAYIIINGDEFDIKDFETKKSILKEVYK